jgi:predicted Zn finger-like uncharacterized protein
MILTCPSCGTRYVVKDGAIPPEGRTVRCAQCKHSWHQDAEASAEAVPDAEPIQHLPEQGHGELGGQPAEAWDGGGEGTDHAHPDQPSMEDASDVLPGPSLETEVAASALVEDNPVTEETFPVAEALPDQNWEGSVDPVAPPEPDTQPYPEDVVPAESPPEPESVRSSHPLRAARSDYEDSYSPFADQDEAELPKRRWPIVVLSALLLIAAIAAAIWFLAPAEFKNRLGLAQASGETPLLVQVKQHSRQELASGNQLLEVSGMVINPTDEPQTVPPLNAQLRSLEQKVVYSWTISPPAPRLAPGASASFNSSNLDIPATAACLEVFFGKQDNVPQCRDSAVVGA